MANRRNDPAKYIAPLYINHLEGRMLRIINKKNATEILFVGDLSANLEFWWGLIRALHDFGSVTAPDLPGIGGMTSFFKIGKRPTLDNYSDYLSSFVKMSYRNRRIVVVGVGFGFVAVTRMLARNPDIAARVNLLISLGGYADHEDFISKPYSAIGYRLLGKLFSMRMLSIILGSTVYSRYLLKHKYMHRISMPNSSSAKKILAENEVQRWLSSDLRTFGAVVNQLTTFSNCGYQISLNLYHVSLGKKELNQNHIEQHLKIIFKEVIMLQQIKKNVYSLKKDKRSAGAFLPPELKHQLRLV